MDEKTEVEPKKKKKPEQTFGLHELAQKHGQLIKTFMSDESPLSADHLAADAFNGWTRHFNITGEKVTLDDETYLAALSAAKRGKAHDAANKRGK